MKKRKTLILLTALLLTAGLTTACDTADEAPQVSDSGKEAVTDEGKGVEEATTPGESGGDEAETVNTEEARTVSDTEEAELIGLTVYDESQNEKKLSEYVAGNKVTMINFWGTFCGPCINEMPYLAELEKKYRDKGFEIVGVTTDATDYDKGGLMPDVLKDADDIVAETGVEYPICYASLDLVQYTQLQAVPTTLFVDERGNLMTDPMVGSRSMEDWESIIKDLLEI